MSQFFKQSTAASLIIGPILDSTGAEYTSASIGDISLSKNGGTLTALASAATLTHIANGQYTLALTTGNTDTLGRGDITCNKSTYQMPPVRITILQATVFDALVTNAAGGANGLLLSLASNGVNVTQLLGTAWLTPGVAGTPDVNAKLIGGTAQTGRDLGAITANTITHLNQIYDTDYATIYDTTNKAFLSKLGNFAMGGSSLVVTYASSQDFTSTQKTSITTAATAATPSVTVSDKTGFSLANGSFVTATFATCDFTATMKTSLNNATPAVTVSDKTGFSLANGSFVTATFGVCDFTSTQKTSITTAATAATPSVTVSDKTGFSLANGSFVTATFGTCDLTSTMKTSVTTAATAATPTINATQAFSNTGTWTGNIVGTVSTLTTYTGNTPQTANVATLITTVGAAGAGLTSIPDSAGVTTLLARLPAAFFAGITSLAKWLGIIAGKTADAGTLAEVNATTAGVGYDNTTDSLDAIRERGDTAWGSSGGLTQADVRTAIGMAAANLDAQLAALTPSSGSGAWTVALTVNDGATALQSANVRMTKGATTIILSTDAAGLATFAVDTGTWTVTISMPGYSFTSTTLAVSSNMTHTYSMTALNITPSAAGLTTGYLTCLDQTGAAEAGVAFTYRAIGVGTLQGLAIDRTERTATSAVSTGLTQFPGLVIGAQYTFTRANGQRVTHSIPSTAGPTYELPAMIGT